MAQISEKRLEDLLRSYAEKIGITEKQRDIAETKYKEIGNWLHSGPFFKDYAPIVYAHGSFALGTIVRPKSGDEFDLDLIVQLTKGDILHSSKEIKAAVNERLKEEHVNNPCLEADKTSYPMCYTLSFKKHFNMDVVPATYENLDRINHLKVTNPQAAPFLDSAIKVVDRKDQWIPSNPKGFIKWFDQLSKQSYHTSDTSLVETIKTLPANLTHTPLQCMVQILKKHANVMFASDKLKQYKPPSIAITTLAALSYKKEYSLYGALFNFRTNALNILGVHLELENPANPGEWFSQNWEHDEVKKKFLLKWLDSVDLFIRNMLNMSEDTTIENLEEFFTKETIIEEEPVQTSPIITEYQKCLQTYALPQSVPYAEIPKSPKNIKYSVVIKPKIKVNELWRDFDSFDIFPLPKKKQLRFEAHTDCPPPYTLRWQVVNTGDEARQADCLRGNIFDCEVDKCGKRLTTRQEKTLYTGIHWVQCYIFDKDGVIVAESKKCYVPIK